MLVKRLIHQNGLLHKNLTEHLQFLQIGFFAAGQKVFGANDNKCDKIADSLAVISLQKCPTTVSLQPSPSVARSCGDLSLHLLKNFASGDFMVG